MCLLTFRQIVDEILKDPVLSDSIVKFCFSLYILIKVLIKVLIDDVKCRLEFWKIIYWNE